jgi:hypothetical protein
MLPGEATAALAEPFVKAKEADKRYARIVAGGIHMRSLSSVWGPIDGTGLNPVDTKRMQDEVYDYVVQRVEDKLEEEKEDRPADPRADGDQQDDVENERTIMAAKQEENMRSYAKIIQLAGVTRDARVAFNQGWDNMRDMGIVNEVVSVETQILLMLRQIGCINAWDKIILGSPEAIISIRMMRRTPKIMPAFAGAVSAVMITSTQTRPTHRPTKAVLQQANINAGIHFQMLVHALGENRNEMIRNAIEVQGNPDTSVYSLDYCHPIAT